MTRNYGWACCIQSLAVIACGFALAQPLSAVAAERGGRRDSQAVSAPAVELFDAVRDGQLEAKIVVRNDHAARVILTNLTDEPLNLQLPEAFAAVPVLAQFGGGGGGNTGGGGGGQQSSGGGFGGGQQGGGGGGMFSIAPERTEKINVAVLCLDHGLRDPSSSKPYRLVPVAEHVDRPAVVELLKAFGNGQLNHAAAQAAVWHLNSDVSWQELVAKRQGTRRSVNRPPYFSQQEIHAGMAYAQQAALLAQHTARRPAPQPADYDSSGSEAKSTAPDADETVSDDEE